MPIEMKNMVVLLTDNKVYWKMVLKILSLALLIGRKSREED